MPDVAARLLGECNQRLSNPPRDVRFGNHGSISVNFESGQFYDHENSIGGGVIDLIMRKTGRDRAGAMSWLRSEGLIEESKSASSSIVATYDYTDEDGALLFQVCRFEPKTLRQRRPDGRGGWVWSLGETRRVLYRLPELAGAIVFDETIYVVEGERDVESLRDNKLTAATNPGGAGKWRAEYSESLRGGDVVIIPDNDKAGHDHAQQVAASLHGIAKRVRVLDLAKIWSGCPDKADVSDWLASGGTVDKLRVAVELLPDWNPSESAAEDPTSVANVAFVAWPEMDGVAYHGLAGDVVKAFIPHTESDPVAILLQFLIYFGNAIGSGPYYQVEAHRHRANLYAVLVGKSAKARKGTSGGRAQSVFTDPNWLSRMKGGLSSGEGFINEVRDQRKEWNRKEAREEIVDPGVGDKRLMVMEPEFAGALRVMERHGNNLSPHLRKAWDGGILSTMTKHSPITATGAHISIVGHITEDELRANLTRTDMASGLANRFLFACVKRSKYLPFGGSLDEASVDELASRVAQAIARAKNIGRVIMTQQAREDWARAYEALSAEQPGLLGAITARAEAQVIRLALVYALLDCPEQGAAQISAEHLAAALGVWEYCEASAAHIFGDAIGDPIADEISAALRQAGGAGMTRTAIRDLFGRHRSTDRVGQALALLATRGRARMETRTTGGRPSEVWFLASPLAT
jgi:hypothetical protein